MLYAVVDIETTGGYASANGITEIAIRITDGKQIISTYETLVNPVYLIPKYVQSLTGITDEMVQHEKVIGDIAGELYNILYDKVFVAHNVNFDYSFIKHHLGLSGYHLNCKKVCTIRFGRQILPGYRSYSLGNFCREIGIDIENRHRAGGDADATVLLFHHLLSKDSGNHIGTLLKGKSNEQSMPPHLPVGHIKNLPTTPGVYYFHDNKGKTIYVGKAKNLQKRVTSHFSNNKPNSQKQEFLRKIHNITFKTCATELMAFILESVEIKKLWPSENRSLKRFEHSYALYSFEDRNGYLRLAIEKKKNILTALYTFNLLVEGHNLLRNLSVKFRLCPKLCYLQLHHTDCVGKQDGRCSGVCEGTESKEEYNERVRSSIDSLNVQLPTFILKDKGIEAGENSFILMEKGRFYGMGNLSSTINVSSIKSIKEQLTPYSENDYIRGLIYQHAIRFPEKKMMLEN